MYELTALYLYKAVFMAELLVAEFLMCFGMKHRSHFVPRLIAADACCIGFAFALPVVAYNALYTSTVFLVMFAFTLLAIKFCYDESWVSVIFRGVAAYTTQHVTYQFFDLVMLGLDALLGSGAPSAGGAYGDGGVTENIPILVNALRTPGASLSLSVFSELQQWLTYCSYAFIYLAGYAVSFSFVSSRLKDSDKFELKSSALFVFVVFFVLFNVIITSIVTYYSGPNFDAFYVIVLAFYNIVCSFFNMYLMFEVIYRKQLKRSYLTANRMLKESEEQYELAKENIELINLKCHDLKHQIRLFGSGTNVDGEAIKEIEEMISVYDANIRTGNEALDIILTEKSLYCNKHGIRLYCIVDGSLLTFMSAADLYSLFGNLLDNAIEATEHLEEEKRFINLSVRSMNGFPMVATSNCLPAPLTFDDGLPKTTKQNKDLHGYGMKSIRLICKKYGGELNVSTDNGMFDLNIVFMK